MTINDAVTDDPTQVDQVRVSLMGGDVQSFDYEDGLTVGDWLTKAAIQVGTDKGISLNGQMVEGLDSRVPANSILIVAAKVSNG